MICPQCGTNNDEDNIFCQNCGTKIIGDRAEKIHLNMGSNNGFFAKMEKKVYFKIARVFTWLLLLIASIVFIGLIFYITKKALSITGGNTNVTKEEVQTALAEEEKGRPFIPQVDNKSRLDIELIKRLDSEITDVVYLFPEELRRDERAIEQVKRAIKEHLSYWPDINDRISVVKSLKKEMQGFVGDTKKTFKAVIKFIEIKKAKETHLKGSYESAKLEIKIAMGVLLIMIVIITLGSLVLVLMAIERNTRKQ